ncbi:MAG: glycosyltransferase [Sphingopyxis sp.]|nr:glycosyltransferase [Sphingopyxis sp.]
MDTPTEQPIHVLSLSTLFPDQTRPNFGIFVEKSLASAARQPGVTLTVCAPVGRPPWPLSRRAPYAGLSTLPAQEQWRGLTVERPRFTLLPGIARRNAAAVAAATLPIARAIHARRPIDVIDAQFFWPDGPAARIIAQALGLPYSIKARGADISLWAHRADTAPLIRAAAADAAGLLAVATTLRDDMVAAGLPGERIKAHYTGLDAALFRPLDRDAARAQWGVAGDAPVLLTVGALIPRKGQEHVIRALPLLPPDTRYLIAGSGTDATRLAALAGELGVGERVRLLGAVPNAELASLYNAADVMVLPSASEGLANAWVEALACGTPLVLSDIPPAAEILDQPDAGRSVAIDPNAIAAAVGATLAQKTDRAALSARTHHRFSWERNGAELAAYWRGLAGHR